MLSRVAERSTVISPVERDTGKKKNHCGTARRRKGSSDEDEEIETRRSRGTHSHKLASQEEVAFQAKKGNRAP